MYFDTDVARHLQEIVAQHAATNDILSRIAGALETLAESRRKKDGETESLISVFLDQIKKDGLIDSQE